MAALGIGRGADAKGADGEDAPGDDPKQKEQPEDKQRDASAGHGRHKADQILMMRGDARRDLPGQEDGEEGEDGGDGMPAQEMAEVAGGEQIEKRDGQREDNAGESLSEDAEGAADSEADGGFEAVLFLGEGAEEEIEGEGGPEAEEDVAEKEMAEEEDAVGGDEGECGVEGGGGGVEEAASEREGGDEEGEGRPGNRQTRGPIADVEETEADGGGPVEKGGMVGVADAVGVGSDPVAAGEHLAGDFRAEGVGAVEERRLNHGKRGVEQHPQTEQRKDETLGRAQAGHRSRL